MSGMADFDVRVIGENDFAALYTEQMMMDFPPDELRPLWAFKPLFEKGIYTCYGYYKGSERVAYGSLVRSIQHNSVLLDYFAVSEKYRGQGIGTLFLEHLISQLDCDGMLLEVEPILNVLDAREKEIRRKRIVFYERCGAVKTTVTGLVFGVVYMLMYRSIKKDLSAEKLLEIINDMYAFMLPEDLLNEQVNYVNDSNKAFDQ